jgi:hypothetical protein
LWLSYPAVGTLVLSRPAFREKVAAVVERPFDRFLIARARGQKRGEPDRTAVIVAPFERSPDHWASLPWRFYEMRELVDWAKPDSSGWHWSFVTVADLLRSFGRIHPHAMLDAVGMPCDGDTRGPLRRVALLDGPKYVTGKESLGSSDDPALVFTTPAPLAIPAGSAATDPGDDCDWAAVRAGLAVIGAAPVARRMKLDPRSVRYWLDGSCKPRSPHEVAQTVVACAAEAGYLLPADGALNAAAICAHLPSRAAIVRRFLGTAINLLAHALGGTRELERATGVAESTLRNWRELCFARNLRPTKHMRTISSKLARFGRAEIKRARRRFSFDVGPIGDLQRIHVAVSLSVGDARPVILPAEQLYAAMAEIVHR